MRGALGREEADRDSGRVGPPRAPDPVQVVRRRSRQVVVHYGRERLDVEATTGDIGRDQHRDTPRLEVGERRSACALAQIPVKRSRSNARASELRGDVVGRVAGRDEDERALPFLDLEQASQEHRAPARVDLDRALSDLGRFGERSSIDVDGDGIHRHLGDELLDGCRKGRREEEGLASRGKQRDDASELVGEAAGEQPVGLVEHQRIDAGEVEGVVRDEVEKTAGRPDDDIRPSPELEHLRMNRDPAERDARLRRRGEVPAEALDGISDLRRELARRHDDDHANGEPRARSNGRESCEPLENREHVRRGLPGARDRRGPDVAPREDRRDRPSLDFGRIDEAELRQATDERGGEAEGRERHGRRRSGSDRRGSLADAPLSSAARGRPRPRARNLARRAVTERSASARSRSYSWCRRAPSAAPRPTPRRSRGTRLRRA